MRQDNKETKKEKKYSKLGSLAWALKKLWRLDRMFVFFIFAIVPIAVVQPLLNSFFSKELIDRIGGGASFSELTRFTVSFLLPLVLLELLRGFINSRCRARQYYPTSIYQTEMGHIYHYETDFENTEKQEYRKIHEYASGDSRQGNCALEFLWLDLSDAFINFLGIFTYASLLIVLNPIIFAVVAVVSVLSYFTTRWQPAYFEKNKHHWEKEVRKRNYLRGLSENFSMAKDIKLYNLEGWLDKMMRDYQSYLIMWNKRCTLRGLFASVLAGLMTFIQNSVAYAVLIGLLLAGKITVGEFVFYFGLTGSIAGFLQGIITSVAKLNTRAEKIAYYRDFYNYPNTFNHGEGCPLPTGPVTIELKDVHYRYDGAEKDTINGLNLTVSAGESLALVGMNGAGKTTLIKLICGLYAPTSGEILVNGKHINEYNIEEYYSMISAVFQDIKTIAFSMFEFVASVDLTRPTAREDAIAAMRLAGIYEKIEKLPNGIDTHLMKGIHDDSVDLSGGEMQKLVLARAIYKNGSILILDEPTAALDPIAENNLYLRYRELTEGKTSIYISHRFASTRFCDRIILLEDGVIAESGTHEELMATRGKYAEMFEVQSKYYKEGEVHA
ncbi:MAG: ABC transporter ATP-binding protein [Lachnospiraceae bacterium]|nr:ABC transporter ATP-binding protein [Lachnospiraceae bacterium]